VFRQFEQNLCEYGRSGGRCYCSPSAAAMASSLADKAGILSCGAASIRSQLPALRARGQMQGLDGPESGADIQMLSAEAWPLCPT